MKSNRILRPLSLIALLLNCTIAALPAYACMPGWHGQMTMLSSIPSNNSTQVSPGTSLQMTFDYPVDPMGAAKGALRLYTIELLGTPPNIQVRQTPVAGTISVSGNTAMFTPSTPLLPNMRYVFLAIPPSRSDAPALKPMGIYSYPIGCGLLPHLQQVISVPFMTAGCPVTPLAGTGSRDVQVTRGSISDPMQFEPGRRYDFESHLFHTDYTDATWTSQDNILVHLGNSSEMVDQWYVPYPTGHVGIKVNAENIRFVPAPNCQGGSWVADRIIWTRYDYVNAGSGGPALTSSTIRTQTNATVPNPSLCHVIFRYLDSPAHEAYFNQEIPYSGGGCGTLSWHPH